MKKNRGRDIFQRYRRIILFFSRCCLIMPLKIRKKLFERKRYSKGFYGIAVRYILFCSIAQKCGSNVLINQGCYILNPERMCVGNNVSIQPMCYLEASGGIVIGDDVSIAHGATILSSSHNYKDISVPIKDQSLKFSQTKIGSNVWMGAKATILCGINIEDGCVIGAGAVVTHDIKKDSVVAGVPAKMVKTRL